MNALDFITRHQESYKSIASVSRRRERNRRYAIVRSKSVGSHVTRVSQESGSVSRSGLECVQSPRSAGQLTESLVQFDRQLDKVAIWLEQWDHRTRCLLLEAILFRSSYAQWLSLFTVLQPSLHRDLMYTAHTHFPDSHFTPISTHASRELKEKLSKLKMVTFHRVQSCYPRRSTVNKLPSISGPSGLLARALTSPAASPGRPLRAKTVILTPTCRSLGQQGGVGTEKWSLRSARTPKSGVSKMNGVSRSNSSVEMHVRRHIQNESSRQSAYRSEDTADIDTPAHFPPVQQDTWTKDCWTVRERKLPEEGKQIITWYSQVWNGQEKNAFFRKLLMKLDPREHYFLSAFLFMRQHIDFLIQLPESVALHILSFLSPKELVDVSRVCKAWRRLANHNSLWETKCREIKLDVPVSENPVWKRVFKGNHFLRLNWNKGLCRVTDFKGHRLPVLAVTCDRTRVVSGSADTTVRVWNLRTGKRLHVLTGHTKGVWCLQFFTQHLLVSGSFDCTMRIWNLRTGTLSRTLLGHGGPVWCMARRGNILVSGSSDKTAKVWDINRCLLLNTLIGHKAPVFAVDMNESGSTIFTGSADRTVRLWCRKTGQCERRINVGGTSGILAISCSNQYFACSHGTRVSLYKGTSHLATFSEHEQRVETVKLRVDPDTGEGMMVSGGQDGLCKYWDIHKGQSVQTFSGHTEAVNCIYFDKSRIVSASYDHRIRLLNFDVYGNDDIDEYDEEDYDDYDGDDDDDDDGDGF